MTQASKSPIAELDINRANIFDDGKKTHYAKVEYHCSACGLRDWQETGLIVVTRGYVVLVPDICSAWLCARCGGHAARTGRFTPLDWSPRKVQHTTMKQQSRQIGKVE